MDQKDQKEVFDKLREGLLAYDEEAVAEVARKAVADGVDVLGAIDVLTGSIREFGGKFETGEVFLPELMMAAETLDAGMAVLTPAIPKGADIPSLGTVVIGTVQGDIHHIGKTLVKAMLSAVGFDVVDIGIDQPASAFAEAAEKNKATIVAASALMSTTRPQWREIVEYFEAVGIREKYKIMVGGGGEHYRDYAEEIGADGFGKDAAEAFRAATELVRK